MPDRSVLSIEFSAKRQGPVLLMPQTVQQVEALRQAAPAGPNARIVATLKLTRFSGEANQTLPVLEEDGGLTFLIGLGKLASTKSLREAAAAGLGAIPSGQSFSLALPAPAPGLDELDLLRAGIEGLLLGGYRYKFGGASQLGAGQTATLLTGLPAAPVELARARARIEGMLLTRDLVNQTAEELGPGELAAVGRGLAQEHGWTAHTWTGEECRAQGFRLVHAVGRCADRPPTVTVIDNLAPGQRPTLALIGKGVVFDTGGLNLKPGNSMALMRKDMGGAGTLLGALSTLGRLGHRLPFLAVIPAAENAIGPGAMRPGDVFRAFDGQSVEIGNTDAEGRLLLADAIGYARQRGAERLLDLATLTGSARVALGPDLPALFGTDRGLVDLLLQTSRRYDEPLWELPLHDDYERELDTPFADLNNASNDSRAGAITAALFLRRFAKDTPWAHVDLYAWEDRGRPGTPRGGNGMCVRTVADVVETLGH
jgi:leucyl aminopeptidase